MVPRPPGLISRFVGTSWGTAGCLHASPPHGTLLRAGTPLYLSPQPQGWLPLHQSCPWCLTVLAWLPIGSFAPASRSLCGSLMMKTSGHMKVTPFARAGGLQATWEAAGSTAPAGMQQPSQLRGDENYRTSSLALQGKCVTLAAGHAGAVVGAARAKAEEERCCESRVML